MANYDFGKRVGHRPLPHSNSCNNSSRGRSLEKLFTRYLSRFAQRAKLETSATNNLVLTFRILIPIGTVLACRAGGLQPEWIISFYAIGGAALGFASTKTLGNFITDLFLLAARAFRIGDYVRIGKIE